MIKTKFHRNLEMNTAHEIEQLEAAIRQYGTVNAAGQTSVSYGILFDKTADICMYHFVQLSTQSDAI